MILFSAGVCFFVLFLLLRKAAFKQLLQVLPASRLIFFLYQRDAFVPAQALEQLSSGPGQGAD